MSLPVFSLDSAHLTLQGVDEGPTMIWVSTLDQQVAPYLRQKLATKQSLEIRRRREPLLEKSNEWTQDDLRTWRNLDVLEQICTAEARLTLQMIADRTSKTRLTEEARASLERLSKRSQPRRG